MKVRRNLEENFTKMDKNCDLKNRIGVKMNKLKLVVVQKSMEEIMDREAEPTLEEGCEHHNLICIGCQDFLIGGREPLQNRVVRVKMVRYKFADLVFI
jgi:hypothetical protein